MNIEKVKNGWIYWITYDPFFNGELKTEKLIFYSFEEVLVYLKEQKFR